MKMRELKLWRRNPRQQPAVQRPKSRRHLMERKADGHQSDSGDARHPSGKAIEAIQPVDGIGDSHQPDHRRQKAEAVRKAIGPAEAVSQGRSIAPIRTPWLQLHRPRRPVQPAAAKERGKRSSARPIKKKQSEPARVPQISWSLAGASSPKPPSTRPSPGPDQTPAPWQCHPVAPSA